MVYNYANCSENNNIIYKKCDTKDQNCLFQKFLFFQNFFEILNLVAKFEKIFSLIEQRRQNTLQ